MVQFLVTKKNPFSEELFKEGRLIKLSKGEVLHDAHDPCTTLGKVISGKLHMYKQLSMGREILLKEFCTGELFAELIVFTGDHFPGWLIAVEDAEVIEVDRSIVLEHLLDKKSLISFITGIASKLNHLTNKIEIMSLKTVQQKIAYCLLHSGRLAIPSVSKTADYLACSREALSRTLTKLEQSGAVSREDDVLKPKNTEMLDKILS